MTKRFMRRTSSLNFTITMSLGLSCHLPICLLSVANPFLFFKWDDLSASQDERCRERALFLRFISRRARSDMDLVPGDANQNYSANTVKVGSFEDSPAKDENDSGLNDIDTNDDGDTSRVVDSATTYARECLRNENYTEATIALRSVIEISEPSTASYKMVMLHIAQLLKAAQQVESSIDCMLTVYQSMPSPFSRIDGICIIACLYEQLGSLQAARFWWKKLTNLSSSNGLDVQLWEAMADRLFDHDLYVLAVDFYVKVMSVEVKKIVPSNRFRYRCLVSLLAFIGPCGPTMHMNLCRSVAWSLAQWFRRRNGSVSHVLVCYGDSNFYRLRDLYFASFPAMHHAVFAWMDGPAGRIARWWRCQWAKFHLPSNPELPSPSRTKQDAKNHEPKKKPKQLVSSSARLPRSQTRTGHGKISKSPSTSPSPTRKCVSDPILKKTNGEPQNKISTKKAVKKTRMPSNNAQCIEENQQFQDCHNGSTIKKRPESIKFRTGTKKSNEFYVHSPTKRRLNAVKHLRRKRSSVDPTVERSSSAGVEKTSSDGEQRVRSSSASLLDVYPLQLPKPEDFIATCGREPGFADLDLNEVGEFARLAHYRARVLAGKHVPLKSLDTAKVKPQWLQELERAVTLIETHHNLVSGKVVAESDSVAHLSEVHTRLVLQITTLFRQYTSDFGETSFTRRLRGITRKLVKWKFTRISEVVAALDEAKSIATQEEKQRNLEFYHIHRA